VCFVQKSSWRALYTSEEQLKAVRKELDALKGATEKKQTNMSVSYLWFHLKQDSITYLSL
jgi:hypothetical protein